MPDPIAGASQPDRAQVVVAEAVPTTSPVTVFKCVRSVIML
jgi:hypothetical protein